MGCNLRVAYLVVCRVCAILLWLSCVCCFPHCCLYREALEPQSKIPPQTEKDAQGFIIPFYVDYQEQEVVERDAILARMDMAEGELALLRTVHLNKRALAFTSAPWESAVEFTDEVKRAAHAHYG